MLLTILAFLFSVILILGAIVFFLNLIILIFTDKYDIFKYINK